MLQYVLIFFGLIYLNCCSAYGTCIAIAGTSVSSIPISNRRNILPKIYILLMMSGSIFFYSLMITLFLLSKIQIDYKLEDSMMHLIACLMMGTTSMCIGNAMANVSKNCFIPLKKNPEFFTGFMIIIGFCEAVLVLTLILAINLLSKGK